GWCLGVIGWRCAAFRGGRVAVGRRQWGPALSPSPCLLRAASVGRAGRPPILRPMAGPADEPPGATEWAVPGQVGVGPWPGDPVEWPVDGRYDPELLAHGDTRNVVDAYRYWRRAAVAADLAARAHPFHVAIENFGHDHNIGTVVRTANAFGAAGVHIVGRRRWNRRGAMVTDRYLAVHHHDDIGGLVAFAGDRGLGVVAVDNTPGAQRLETATLPR